MAREHGLADLFFLANAGDLTRCEWLDGGEAEFVEFAKRLLRQHTDGGEVLCQSVSRLQLWATVSFVHRISPQSTCSRRWRLVPQPGWGEAPLQVCARR